MAWSGSEYGVCYHDGRTAANEHLYFSRVSAAGVEVGADVLLETATAFSQNCSLVWSGSEYAAAWIDNRSSDNDSHSADL